MKLGDKATVRRCNVCHEAILVGVSISLKPVAVSIEVLDAPRAAALAAKRVKFWHLDEYGTLVPVAAALGVPVSNWRPVHPHPWAEPAKETRTAPLPPCEAVPGPAPVWCLRESPEARACDSCDPAPFSPARALDEACVLLMRGLGAEIIEKETNGRIVYRR